jgi:transcriptional regulator with PAS, ATPase and Fis domain
MIIIKDITELTDIEASLRRQITKKGLIAKYTFLDIKGTSPAIEQCINKAKKIAQIDKPTLIIGESGTGKELFVQSIHNASTRYHYPFVAMNCAAIPDSLLESELFGYEDGAFTGARKGGKEGLFQMAQKGTLFLDEIGELSLSTQAKLLRVLEEKEIMRVGSDRLISVDVRIIAATNRNLKTMVDASKFRLDLFFRLNTLIINIPPLRSRHSDIALLINEFLLRENQGKIQFDPKVWNFLLNYQWTGNIRELKNCIEYAANISDGYISAEYLPDYILEEYNNTVHTHSYIKSTVENINKRDEEFLIAILALLKYEPMGRRLMMQSLEKENLDITEYRLRSLLDYLSQNKYITIGKGRSGCSISDSGKELLNILLRKK